MSRESEEDSHLYKSLTDQKDKGTSSGVNVYVGGNQGYTRMLEDDKTQEEEGLIRKHSSFADLNQTKVQLTWKDVTITAPKKKRFCRKPAEGEEDKVILGKLDIKLMN